MRKELQIANRTERTSRHRSNLQFAICSLQFAILLFTFFSFPSVAAAAPSFPRGEGFYYNPFKFLAVLVLYLCWVRTCWWVDVDARQLKLPRKTWNPLLLGSGLLGLLAVWAIKAFVPAFFFLLLL